VSRKLDGDVSNSARGACDQHPFAWSEPPVHEQCLPGGQPSHRQSCRLDVAQLRWLRCKRIGRDDGVLGSHAVAIERRERINRVTAAGHNARKLVRRVAGSRSTGQSSSSRVIAAARTRTSTSPGSGDGVSISSTFKPSSCSRTASTPPLPPCWLRTSGPYLALSCSEESQRIARNQGERPSVVSWGFALSPRPLRCRCLYGTVISLGAGHQLIGRWLSRA
jgi:hypothetical protein